MGRLPDDEKNHFILMRILEYRESVAASQVERLLFKIYQRNIKRTTIPTSEEIYSILSDAETDFLNVATVAEYIGQLESILSANAQHPKVDFEIPLPERSVEKMTVRTIENYIQKTGKDLEEIRESVRMKAVQMTRDIASATEQKLRDLVAENLIEGTTHSGSREKRTLYAAKLYRPQNPKKALPTAETIIRTQTMQILNASAVNGAQSTPRLRDYLVGWRYCANGDSRTRETHRQQNGVTAEKNSPFWDVWTPPNGYNCRCFLIPLYDVRKLESGKPPNMSIRPDPGFEFNPAKVYL